MTTNTNVHSHMIRELAERIGKIEVVYGEDGESMSTAKAYLETLATIHEYLSDTEFSSESFNEIDDMFALHGLNLFGLDSQIDSDSLKAKYAGDDSEEIFQPAMHPKYPKREWITMAAEGKTVLGYWEWVESQISQED